MTSVHEAQAPHARTAIILTVLLAEWLESKFRYIAAGTNGSSSKMWYIILIARSSRAACTDITARLNDCIICSQRASV